MINKFFPREEGQGLVEYALILVLVAIVVIAILLQLGPAIGDTFCKVANTLEPGTCGALSVISKDVAISPGKVYLNVTVSVSIKDPSVTLNAEGSSDSKPCNSPPCTLTLTAGPGIPTSGTFTVQAGDAEVSESYP